MFSMDNMLNSFGPSPTVINVSSESGEEFIVDPGQGVGGPGTEIVPAFMGAASATIFHAMMPTHAPTEVIDTAGTRNK